MDGAGTDGDGIATLVGAGLVAGLVFAWRRYSRPALLVAAQLVTAICAAIALFVFLSFCFDPPGTGADGIGWGLILTWAAVLALVVLIFCFPRRLVPEVQVGERDD